MLLAPVLWAVWFECLVVAVGVDAEDSDWVFSVVDVGEVADGDDSDLGAGPPVSELDEFLVVSDVAGGADLADCRWGG